MIIDASWLVLLATGAFIAGFFDTLAGGGLITIPAFLFARFTPAQALATSKCQAFAGTSTAAVRLITRPLQDPLPLALRVACLRNGADWRLGLTRSI